MTLYHYTSVPACNLFVATVADSMLVAQGGAAGELWQGASAAMPGSVLPLGL